jgi:HPt (histidine-containing phosphotransfer) domain-containing protein
LKEIGLPSQLLDPKTALPVLDESRLLDEFGDDPEILAELRDIFLEHIPPLLDKIRDAWRSGKAEAVAGAAHSLKGACSTYGALRLAEISRGLEEKARQGELPLSVDIISLLEEELAQVIETLRRVEVENPD